MESWNIKELKTWINYFGKSKTANYFLGGSDEKTIKKAKRILKEKLKKELIQNVSELMPKVLDEGLPDITGTSIPDNNWTVPGVPKL